MLDEVGEAIGRMEAGFYRRTPCDELSYFAAPHFARLRRFERLRRYLSGRMTRCRSDGKSRGRGV